MKTCTSCDEPKPLEDFYWTKRRNGDKARHSKCQECRRKQFKSWAKTASGKRVKRSGILRRQYGITEAEYCIMFLQQNGICAICHEAETKLSRNGKILQLSVDHDHKTGAVRALLCSSCNVGLGSFKDDPEKLASAISYLFGQAKAAVAA